MHRTEASACEAESLESGSARIGRSIRDLRQAHGQEGLSQRGLAEQLQVSVSKILRWEAGVEAPTLQEFDALARLFKVSITVFLAEQDRRQIHVPLKLISNFGLKTSAIEECVRYAEYRQVRRALAKVRD